MTILITTLGRVDNQVTLERLPSSLCAKLVVQSYEYAQHRLRWPGVEVIRLPATIKTLGPTRKYLISKYGKKGKIILLDDDLKFYIRRDPNDWHLVHPLPEEITQMFGEVYDKLDSYSHVSVSAREGNNHVADYWVNNTRYMRVLGYNTKLFAKGLKLGRVDGMSDFDLNLQLLCAGKPSCVFFRYAQNQSGTQAPGGCSLNRTLATHEDEIRKMLIWHSGFVSKRVKRNKTGGEFGKRSELTIQWKKAYESSKKPSNT